jgi:hypothetical protein
MNQVSAACKLTAARRYFWTKARRKPPATGQLSLAHGVVATLTLPAHGAMEIASLHLLSEQKSLGVGGRHLGEK